MTTISPHFKTTYPGAHAGFLAMSGVTNTNHNADLEKVKASLEEELRSRYTGADRKSLDALPTIQAYNTFYKQFNKTYHVRLQLESILFKGKALPSVSVLVDAMFMAELKNLMLTAGHDLDLVQPPIQVGVAEGGEKMVQFNGQEQVLKTGDMFMADQQGVLSSVIYGPDQHTRIQAGTTRVIYTVYAPQGIGLDSLRAHLDDIRTFVHIANPHAVTEILEIRP